MSHFSTFHIELQKLPAWALVDDGKAITRSFRFNGFGEAFAFMTEVALAAEKMDHHPDWQNVYDRVSITLSTHDEGGLSPKDFALASKIDLIVNRHAVVGAQE